MYAIYKPSSTTNRVAGTIRDITRIIIEGSVANCEFHDTGVTQIVDNSVASGWSLPAGTSLSTDVTPGQNDAIYFLQANSRIGSNKKYCAIMIADNYTSSSSYNSDHSSNKGIKLSGVFDYGSATQLTSVGYPSTPQYDKWRGDGFYYRAHGGDSAFYIFASQDMIMICASDYNGRMHIEGITEFADNNLTQMYRAVYTNSVPHMRFQYRGYMDPSYDRYQVSYNSTTEDTFGEGGSQYNQFIQCLYSPRTQEYYRNLAIYRGRYNSSELARMRAITENATTNGTASTAFTGQTVFDSNVARAMPGAHDAHYSNNIGLRYGTTQYPIGYRRYKKETDGTNTLPLYPITEWLSPLDSINIVNISEYSNIYLTRQSLSAGHGDTITVGSDVYVFLASSAYNNPENNREMLVKIT